jgi:hypothetical protein
VARREDQAEQVVADVVVHGGLQLLDQALGLSPLVELVAQLAVLALQHLAAPQAVERVVLGGRHQPGRRVIGNAGDWPLFERGQ